MFICFSDTLPASWSEQLPPYIPNYHRHRIVIDTGKRRKCKINFDGKKYTFYVPQKVSLGID